MVGQHDNKYLVYKTLTNYLLINEKLLICHFKYVFNHFTGEKLLCALYISTGFKIVCNLINILSAFYHHTILNLFVTTISLMEVYTEIYLFMCNLKLLKIL